MVKAFGFTVVAASCTASYDPVLEFWPDASSTGTTNMGGNDASGPNDESGIRGSTSGDGASEEAVGLTDSSARLLIGPEGGPSREGGSSLEAGSFVESGSFAEGGLSKEAGACSLVVTVTTVSNGGQYSPKNIGAIWIENSSRTFVKTLAVWAATRIKHVSLWNSSTAAAGLPSNKVDAITGATLSSNQTHDVSWNCTNTTEAIVPDGVYYVFFEMDDDNSTGPNTSVAFTKGPTATQVTPPNDRNFINISLTFIP
jgi:hypothetical protein